MQKIKLFAFSALLLGGLVITPSALAAKKPLPMAQCRDKTYSYSLTHRGTCSHHGGVLRWFR